MRCVRQRLPRLACLHLEGGSYRLPLFCVWFATTFRLERRTARRAQEAGSRRALPAVCCVRVPASAGGPKPKPIAPGGNLRDLVGTRSVSPECIPRMGPILGAVSPDQKPSMASLMAAATPVATHDWGLRTPPRSSCYDHDHG